ncbi:ABC transporter substrate-binding protein [Jiangella alba]|uniref:Carbohydrate ABC transporter substrate-binding protein, CUT1 family n=1 Tax=Jiangella alba TaxID=561176 RepID=A0A1H5DAU3_9ACTN|nr:ABC transporter substrate-binding protein [Jiangella alba]SED75994.1 carbohydrate ABC transporter substrate-binding protein, CUT1 family [Jiangella alba]
MTRMIPKAPAGVLAGTLATALLLTACGGGQAAGDDGDGGGPLVVWFPGNSEEEMALVNDTIVPAFEEETGADVEVTFVDWADMSPKLNAAFAAGTAPDVVGHGIAAAADLVANDRVEDLTPYVEELDPALRDDMSTAIEGGKVDGKYTIMPLLMSIRMIVYSGADFAAAGLDPDDPPATWEDVKEIAQTLTVREGDQISRAGLAVPSQPIAAQQSFATLLWSNGGELLADDASEATLDTPEAEEALAYFAGLYQGPDAVDNQLGTAWSDAPEAQHPVVTGAAAMELAIAGTIAKLQAAAPDRDLRLMPPPSFDGHEPAAFGGPANGLMINKDSANKDLAWDFIEYMIDPEVNVDYVQSLGGLPIHASSADAEAFASNPELQRAVEALSASRGNPNVVGWVQMRDAMGQFLERAIHGEASPADALEQADAEVEKILGS